MSFKPRNLDTVTLIGAADHYAKEFPKATVINPNTKRKVGGQGYVIQDFYNFTFRDEFDFLVQRIKEKLSQDDLEEFERIEKDQFEPRRDDVFEKLLLEKLAINPAGEHVLGHKGTTQIGNRVVGRYIKEIPRYARRTWRDRLLFKKHGKLIDMRFVEKREYWPVYEGEPEEREAGSSIVDKLPPDAQAFTRLPTEVLANNPRISAEAAIFGCDGIVDRLDEGSTAATIRGRTGTQPADPDATESGTLLFTLTMSATAFGAAVDAAPGGQATANSITSDSSADATGTLAYCRAGATGTGADDHIDGEAGTASADFIFNTLSIVAGSTVNMTSFTVTVPQS